MLAEIDYAWKDEMGAQNLYANDVYIGFVQPMSNHSKWYEFYLDLTDETDDCYDTKEGAMTELLRRARRHIVTMYDVLLRMGLTS